MHVRRIAQRHFTPHRRLPRQGPLRCHSTPPPSSEKPIGPSQPYHFERPVSRPSWLTRQVKQSPWAVNLFLNLSSVLGYGSAKQVAGRRTLAMYEQICSRKAEVDRHFWQIGESRCSTLLPFRGPLFRACCAISKHELFSLGAFLNPHIHHHATHPQINLP
jgi:hypothetical protein